LLNIAVAYGGRWDILLATRRLAAKVANGDMTVDEIDEAKLSGELQLANCPEPDLLIRTGGEQRVSNFLLWNLAYAELWFTDVLWPDFDTKHFEMALQYFARKQRRYGHTGEQVEVGAAGC
jgi:undecaprenyl diphosphate synthase